MARRVIDHNVVLGIWHGRGPSRKPARSEETARQAARAWLRKYPEDGLITPVRLEFVAGTKDREEQRLGDIFLGEFPVFDDGRIHPEDWVVAERFARRIRGTGGARGVIDCLILAICERLHADLYSLDKGARLH